MDLLFPLYLIGGIFGFIFLITLIRSIRIVPAKTTMLVERLGKYNTTLTAGFHVMVPFIDKVKYKLNMKEMAIDVPAQDCFTLDNVKVRVDGVLYMQVMDPHKASYGIEDYQYATIQLAQTTIRSEIGKLELDKTFEERDTINASVVKAVDEASDPWGIRVSRYEIQNISVPDLILAAMEVQMKSEREKRAIIARSIGDMESNINSSKAAMEEAFNKSEGQKQRLINEAEGRAQEILAVAKATASTIRTIAKAMEINGGEEAVAMQVKENYIYELRKLAKSDTKLILPMDLAKMDDVLRAIDEMLR